MLILLNSIIKFYYNYNYYYYTILLFYANQKLVRSPVYRNVAYPPCPERERGGGGRVSATSLSPPEALCCRAIKCNKQHDRGGNDHMGDSSAGCAFPQLLPDPQVRVMKDTELFPAGAPPPP